MPYKGKLDGKAIETATSRALEAVFDEYRLHNKNCIERQSQQGAFHARKALQRLKYLVHRRKIELLELYTQDERRLNAYHNNINSVSTADQPDTNQEEETNGKDERKKEANDIRQEEA
jgi:DNA replication protein DnaC